MERYNACSEGVFLGLSVTTEDPSGAHGDVLYEGPETGVKVLHRTPLRRVGITNNDVSVTCNSSTPEEFSNRLLPDVTDSDDDIFSKVSSSNCRGIIGGRYRQLQCNQAYLFAML